MKLQSGSEWSKILEKEKQKLDSHPRLKTYDKATVIKTVWYWHKDWQKDQCTTIENPHIDPHIYGQVMGSKLFGGGKHNLFNKWCGDTWLTHAKK